MKLETIDKLDFKYYLPGGFLIKNNNNPITISSKNDVFEVYNDNTVILEKKEKILLEACMVYNLSKRALDFYLGYISPKKDTPKWGWKTLEKAQQANHRYLADKLYFETYGK